MAELHPHFSLQLHSTDNPGAVLWNNKLVTTAIPVSHLAGKHAGEAAFVVASGPSVNKLDISPLERHLTFCVNGSFLKFKSKGFSPDYAVICDAGFVSERWEIVQETIASDTHCLFTPAVLSRICQLGVNVLKNRKVSVIQTHFRHYGQKAMEPDVIARLSETDEDLISQDGRIGFSLNPLKGLFSAHTVAHLPVQLCWYLGVRKVFILGMDLSAGKVPARFYEQGTSATATHLDRDYAKHIEPAFRIAGEMSASHNFRVYNLSENSRLPGTVLPKISLQNALDLTSSTD
jgi:Kdo-III transferase WaaZ